MAWRMAGTRHFFEGRSLRFPPARQVYPQRESRRIKDTVCRENAALCKYISVNPTNCLISMEIYKERAKQTHEEVSFRALKIFESKTWLERRIMGRGFHATSLATLSGVGQVFRSRQPPSRPSAPFELVSTLGRRRL